MQRLYAAAATFDRRLLWRAVWHAADGRASGRWGRRAFALLIMPQLVRFLPSSLSLAMAAGCNCYTGTINVANGGGGAPSFSGCALPQPRPAEAVAGARPGSSRHWRLSAAATGLDGCTYGRPCHRVVRPGHRGRPPSSRAPSVWWNIRFPRDLDVQRLEGYPHRGSPERL